MQKKRPGQPWKPPSAAEANSLIAAADLIGRQLGNVDGRELGKLFRPTDTIKIRNSSGTDLDAGDVLAVSATLVTDLDRFTLWFDGNVFEKAGNGVIAVVAVPITDGEIGEAQISGIALANVNVGHLFHRRAYPTKDAYILSSGFAGPAKLLSRPTSTGEQLLPVLLETGECVKLIVQSTEDIAEDTHGTCNLWEYDADNGALAEVLDGSSDPVPLEVWNWLIGTVGSGKRLIVSSDDDWQFSVDAEACD